VCGKVDPPSEGGGADNAAYETLRKVLLNKVTILAKHAGMMDSEAVWKEFPELSIATPAEL